MADPASAGPRPEQAPAGDPPPQHQPYRRAARPGEIAPSHPFSASDVLSSYCSGEVLAPIGEEVHPG